MQFTQRQLLMVLGGILLAGGVFYFIQANLRANNRLPDVKLTVWGVDDRPVDMQGTIENYKKVRPNVTVAYERIGPERYEQTVLNALAAGKGPDVFMIKSRALPVERERLAPANPSAFSISRLRQLFPTVVEQDFVLGESIYALPASIDTLALIYNKNLFDQAGVTAPPRTWDEFQKIIEALRKLSDSGQVVRAAAAIGGSLKTVHAAPELLEILMMQNGADMIDGSGNQALFASMERGSPGVRAFNFYLQFANNASPFYTWTDGGEKDTEAFLSGKVAMIFGYHRDVAEMKKRSPFLEIGIAPLPQPSGPAGAEVKRVDYAEYSGYAVAKASPSAAWAWDFILSFASGGSGAKAYEESAGKPPASRERIGARLDDPEFGVFARQALTARSWRNPDVSRVKNIFNSAILSVLNGQLTSQKALSQAEDQVTQLLSTTQE